MTLKAAPAILVIAGASLSILIGLATNAYAQTAKPKTVPFDLTISNTACFEGGGVDPHIQRAIAQRQAAEQRGNAGEGASFYVRIPARAWRGLTVTGVGLHYERTSVYFREPVATVARTLRRTGVNVDPDHRIPIVNDEAVEVQILRATPRESRTYGASEVNCGV
jgi:hypothetical protein